MTALAATVILCQHYDHAVSSGCTQQPVVMENVVHRSGTMLLLFFGTLTNMAHAAKQALYIVSDGVTGPPKDDVYPLGFRYDIAFIL
jgi:hypothetical protein